MSNDIGRSAFAQFRKIQTRWMDNDAYGHVNNVTYYSYIDTAVAGFLIDNGLIDAEIAKTAIFIVAETGCTFHRSVAFPQMLEIGLSIARLGTSSVTYRIGVFAEGEAQASAVAKFVHVQVDPVTMRPFPLSPTRRAKFKVLEIH